MSGEALPIGVWLRRCGLIVLLGLLLGAGVGFVWGKAAPSRYQATATLMIRPQVAAITAEQAHLSVTTKVPSVQALRGVSVLPSVLRDAAQQAGLPDAQQKPRVLKQRMVIRGMGETLVQLHAQGNTPEESLALAEGWSQAVMNFTGANWNSVQEHIAKLDVRQAEVERELKAVLAYSRDADGTSEAADSTLQRLDLESRYQTLARWSEILTQLGPDGPFLEVIEPAALPAEPLKTAFYQRLLAASAAGFLLGLAVCVARLGSA